MFSSKALAVLAVGSIGALASVPLMPDEWLQLGVAGISLAMLFFVVTKTGPKMLEQAYLSNERNIKALVEAAREDTNCVVEKLEVLNKTIQESANQQLEFLRSVIHNKL